MNTVLDTQSYEKWLIDTCVYENNTLTINLVGGVTSSLKQDLDIGDGNVIKDVHPVEANGPRYKVYFDDVVFFQAFDECAHKNTDDKHRDKGVIGQYSSSSLLNYIKSHTLIMDITPGEFMHFEVMTGEDWFHVITREEPIVRAVENV